MRGVLGMAWLMLLVCLARADMARGQFPSLLRPAELRALPAGPIPIETRKRAWGVEQLLGEPDTAGSGDIVTAWASATADGQDEWVEVEYAACLPITQIHVYETFNPGALTRVVGYDDKDAPRELWKGVDPIDPAAGRGVAKLEAPRDARVKKLRLHLRSSEVAGWNEIDAVAVIDAEGKTHWAVDASASSTFAAGPAEAVFQVALREPAALELIQAYQQLEQRLRAVEDALRQIREESRKLQQDKK